MQLLCNIPNSNILAEIEGDFLDYVPNYEKSFKDDKTYFTRNGTINFKDHKAIGMSKWLNFR